MDSLAVLYARELSRWGIETTIVVPGAFTKGTNHFAHSGRRLTRRGSRNMKLAPKILPTHALLEGDRMAEAARGRGACVPTDGPNNQPALERENRELGPTQDPREKEGFFFAAGASHRGSKP